MCPVCGKEYDISLQLLGRCSALAEKSVSVTNLFSMHKLRHKNAIRGAT